MEPVHITWSARSRRALFPDEPRRLAAVKALARSRPLLFCVVDDHVHGVWDWPSGRPARSSGVCRALASVADAPLQPGYQRPVEGRRHLLTLVTYLARQPEKHGLGVHPAAWSGSCVADLLGARLLPGFDGADLRRHLPRWRPAYLAEALGLGVELRAASDDDMAGVDWRTVVRCAGSAFGLHALVGKSRAAVRGRRAVFALASAHPGGVSAVRHILGVHRDAARRMVRCADPPAVATVRRAVMLARLTRLAGVG